MSNNPAQDRYNPRGVGKTEYDTMKFEEVAYGTLWWPYNTTNDPENQAFRKIDEATAMNTKTQEVLSVHKYRVVYQKI